MSARMAFACIGCAAAVSAVVGTGRLIAKPDQDQYGKLLNVRAGATLREAAEDRSHHGRVVILHIQLPLDVRMAGTRGRDEWYYGRRVASEEGCAACHRIGESGNRGPGMELTHIGDRLNESEIKRILIAPPAQMPSFGGSDRKRLRALARFFAALRS
ncbi:MAG: hypothetical protein ACYCUM_03595 [Solirubrobacteraceae bacterium]